MSNEHPVHKEHFDVVLVKEGVPEHGATMGDIKRVSVQAESPIAAQMAVHEKGFRVHRATPPGMLTDLEVFANRRTYDGGTTDPTKW
jgi:hypothetical protein